MLGQGAESESGDGAHLQEPEDREPGPEPSEGASEDAPDEGPAGVACPSCGYVITPPPTRNRRCPACHETIVVRRFEGRTVYLTEGAVEVFAAERQRDTDDAARDAQRGRWLALAASVGVPRARRAKLEAAEPSERSVEASRTLYTSAADQAAARARRDKRWIDVGRVRRAQAAAEYAFAGSPVPPPDNVVELQREGMLALLRSFAAQGSDAELVGAGCCRICRADDGKVFRITNELREPRLPHVGCTKGICACDWWIGVIEKKRRRRRPGKPAGGSADSPAAQ